MIKRLVVKGLNNRSDGNHDLEFHPDLNLFTGPNGSGKTTLLKLIWYLISGNLERILSEIPFQFVSIETALFSAAIARVTPGKVELTSQFVGEKASTERIAVDWETGTLARSGEALKVNALNHQIAQAMKNSIFFPDCRRAEGGKFSYLANGKKRGTLGFSPLASDTALNEHQFIASVSTEALGQLLTQNCTDSSENPKALLAELSRKILRYRGIRLADRSVIGKASGAVSFNKLSAGEKQMLNFLCYNAFSDNTAIFIDEPELSLHGDWQRLLLPVLLEQKTGNQFFVATHSPFIYAKYPDKDFFLGDTHGGKI